MENRELKMIEVQDTPSEYLQEGLNNSKHKIKILLNTPTDEILSEAMKLVTEKEFLKATIKYQKDKIIKLQSDGQ